MLIAAAQKKAAGFLERRPESRCECKGYYRPLGLRPVVP